MASPVTTYGGVATRAAKLTSRIPQIIAELSPEVDAAIKEGADAISEGAKERVPVETGALRDAIHVEQIEGGYAVVAGDTEAFYGHIVEHGSVNQGPHPFLVPAYEAERENLNDIVSEHLKDL